MLLDLNNTEFVEIKEMELYTSNGSNMNHLQSALMQMCQTYCKGMLCLFSSSLCLPCYVLSTLENERPNKSTSGAMGVVECEFWWKNKVIITYYQRKMTFLEP